MADQEPQDGAVRALSIWVGPEVSVEQIEAVVARLRARKGVRRVEVRDVTPDGKTRSKARKIAGASAPLAIVDEIQDVLEAQGYYDADLMRDDPDQAPQNVMDDDVCFCGCTRKQHRSSPAWGESCDGCSAKGPRATYQWRHPYTRDVGAQPVGRVW